MFTDKLFRLPSFQRQYEALQILSVCETVPNLECITDKKQLLEKIDWNNLLGIASALGYSDKNEHLDAALRIAQTCISQNCTDAQKCAAVVILNLLTNKPALALAMKRDLIDINHLINLPLPFNIQTTNVNIENAVLINDRLIQLNRFQKDVYISCEKFDTI